MVGWFGGLVNKCCVSDDDDGDGDAADNFLFPVCVSVYEKVNHFDVVFA